MRISIQIYQPAVYQNCSGRCFSSFAKIPVTIKSYRCLEPHPGTFFKYVLVCLVHILPAIHFPCCILFFFLQNLDALHDHLGTLYPGMKAPSFRCTERTEDGALVLHYYSDRPGLEYIVIGIVKVVKNILFTLKLKFQYNN